MPELCMLVKLFVAADSSQCSAVSWCVQPTTDNKHGCNDGLHVHHLLGIFLASWDNVMRELPALRAHNSVQRSYSPRTLVWCTCTRTTAARPV